MAEVIRTYSDTPQKSHLNSFDKLKSILGNNKIYRKTQIFLESLHNIRFYNEPIKVGETIEFRRREFYYTSFNENRRCICFNGRGWFVKFKYIVLY